MIYSRSFKYIINPEKIKGFIDYLYVFTQKARMFETNLSFEYGLEGKDKIIVLQRWSTRQSYQDFINIPEFDKEIKTLEKCLRKLKFYSI
ncbi:antibiotic biosynthesis monooxygenase [Mycoplasmopsis cynos]|uniref:antibiotic biosynthesis monooxygenase n=1 Tax=Mycoplasmopsis cynos TaxID=171284 RepID=UPI002204AFB4|nr:antibiotic biosynthesis monooxygenase [Mycoplasmopsis cynos]UWV77353.1 antibiotic biosynthesis monooxygenase [Mycoplasmopsis cynos]UWV92064.1 antibiotic biosynthesis monooxygenase [Mycoplasmopsis cynos]WAM04481.1 antibiotic biosynthesis monooxygenase [Mycoplasmopsis cynos]WAM07986.1 antibiotic biosynthesis monooxygenase [Mycoplasmopsis cynos]WAM10669.1 antibiotic biosynthesis monooxygenase [Mycoplasmopsis cynos]